MSMTTSFEPLSEVHRQPRHETYGPPRVVAVDVKRRAPIICDVGAALVDRNTSGRGGEADRLSDDDVWCRRRAVWTDSPGSASHDHTLTGERGIAMQHHGNSPRTPVGPSAVDASVVRLHPAWPAPIPSTGSASRRDAGWRSATPECRCRRTSAGTARWRLWYLTSLEPCACDGFRLPSNSVTRVRLADDVNAEPVPGAASR